MWRFLLQENIRRYREQIADERSDSRRTVLQLLLHDAEAELDQLERASFSQVAHDDPGLRIIAERAIDDAMKRYGAQFGTLHIYDDELGGLVILAQRNFRAEFLASYALVTPDETAVSGRAFTEGRTIVVEDIRTDLAFAARREAAREGGFEAVQSSPVRNASGRVLGVLSTHFTTPQRFSAQDIEKMDRHANSVGASLERHLAAAAASQA